MTTPDHWSRRAERTSVFGIRFLLGVHRLFGRSPFLVVLTPVLFFYWFTNRTLREASFSWLRAVGIRPTHGAGLRHLRRFAETLTDGFLAAAGRMSPDMLRVEGDELFQADPPTRGCIILTAHTGCREILQIASSHATHHPIVVLQYTSHARRFNELLREAGAVPSNLRFFEVGNVTPNLAMELSDLVEKGAYLIIAGDRSPTGSERAVTTCSFMERPALFPTGGALLALLLQVPLRMMIATRTEAPSGPRYRVRFETLDENPQAPRKARQTWLADTMQRYASILEEEMRSHPYDWFNFFDFWESAR